MFTLQLFYKSDRQIVLPFGQLFVERRRLSSQQNPDVPPGCAPYAKNFALRDKTHDRLAQKIVTCLKFDCLKD